MPFFSYCSSFLYGSSHRWIDDLPERCSEVEPFLVGNVHSAYNVVGSVITVNNNAGIARTWRRASTLTRRFRASETTHVVLQFGQVHIEDVFSKHDLVQRPLWSEVLVLLYEFDDGLEIVKADLGVLTSAVLNFSFWFNLSSLNRPKGRRNSQGERLFLSTMFRDFGVEETIAVG